MEHPLYLDVSVGDPLEVEIVEAAENLPRHVSRLRLRHAAPGLETRAQATRVQELQEDAERVSCLYRSVGGRNPVSSHFLEIRASCRLQCTALHVTSAGAVHDKAFNKTQMISLEFSFYVLLVYELLSVPLSKYIHSLPGSACVVAGSTPFTRQSHGKSSLSFRFAWY